MGLTFAILTGAGIGLGLAILLAGLTPQTPNLSTVSSTSLLTRCRRWWETTTTRGKTWLLGSLVAGVVAAVWTGWALAAVILPAILVLIPYLLSAPAQREVDLLAGLDRWVRLLSASLSSGKSIRDAVYATRRQAPEVLRAPIGRLCARLDQRWGMRDALWATGDELGSADADAVVAALAIASAHGGAGARATLDALSDTLQHRLRALREIAAERAKPRAVVRQVTIVTLVVLIGVMVLNPHFFAPYGSALGQLIAALLAGTYLGCLFILRRRTVPSAAPRFLGRAT